MTYGDKPRPSKFVAPGKVEGSVCGFIFGDSMAHADEVQDEEAWGELLSNKLGCLIANYGVGGFGTDQTKIRMEEILPDNNGDADSSKIVFISVYQEMLRRNMAASWLFYCCPDAKRSIKPFFRLQKDGETLKYFPIPKVINSRSIKQHHAKDIYYQFHKLKFPYVISVSKQILNSYNPQAQKAAYLKVQNGAFDDREASNLQLALMQSIAEFSRGRGYITAFIFFPAPNEAHYNVKPYKNFLDRTVDEFKDQTDVLIIDIFDGMHRKSRAAGGPFRAPDGHYDARGNHEIAKLLFSEISHRN